MLGLLDEYLQGILYAQIFSIHRNLIDFKQG